MMSNTGAKRTFAQAARHLYALGGFRAYYRGLTVCPRSPVIFVIHVI